MESMIETVGGRYFCGEADSGGSVSVDESMWLDDRSIGKAKSDGELWAKWECDEVGEGV